MNRYMRVCVFVSCLLISAVARAEDVDLLPPTITFVISTGYWEVEAEGRKGYYKLVSVRQTDRSSMVYLQQVAMTDTGTQIVSTVGVSDLNMLHPYVTDIRAEASNGTRSEPGLFATVYLRTDPAATESESFTVIVDEFGELKVGKASN